MGNFDTAIQKLREATEELKRANDAAIPWKPKGLPVAEIDCTLEIGGDDIAVTLRVWGKFHEAHFEVVCIMLGETDVTEELGARGEEIVSEYVIENCDE